MRLEGMLGLLSCGLLMLSLALSCNDLFSRARQGSALLAAPLLQR